MSDARTRPTTLAARRDLFEAAAAVVRAECGRDLTLAYVARRVHSSRRQLQRVFREVAGTGFRDYVARVRLERAAELARADPARPMTEIARAVGYTNPSSFSAAFRRHHGVPPSEVRRSVAGGGRA